ncbi:alkaline phosphatase family protein [Gemmatimonas sp.]
MISTLRSALSAFGRLVPVVVAVAAMPLPAQSTQPLPTSTRTEHVIVVLTDGLRWQELFRGADAALMQRRYVNDTASLRRDFWRASPEARRETLLPFVWSTVAQQGQIFGDSAGGSMARVTNRFRFSYPGYNETFTGFFDPRIDSNGYPPNPNTTVLEWLNRDAALSGGVVAHATWNAFRRIINTERSGVPVLDGWDRGAPSGADSTATLLQALYRSHSQLWPDVALDAPMHQAVLRTVHRGLPRVLFVGYGETDEWAHSGRYDMYLRSAHQVDRFLAELWNTVQGNPRTRDKVTLLISTDHGRGWDAKWTDHGEEVDGAQFIWSAVIGPDTPPLGVRANTPTQQAQMAATIAALLGRDWRRAEPRAAPALPVFR